jgi:hypothetical protein
MRKYLPTHLQLDTARLLTASYVEVAQTPSSGFLFQLTAKKYIPRFVLSLDIDITRPKENDFRRERLINPNIFRQIILHS